MERGIARVTMGIVFAISSFSLSGCLVNRILTVQEQACAFDENFEVSLDNGMKITFLNPVLLFNDVAFIVGLAPQTEKLADNHYRASYMVSMAGNSDALDTPVNLLFEKQDNELKLTQVSIPNRILASFDRAQFPQAIDSACNTRLPLWGTRVEVPIPEFDQSIIPSREQAIELAGKPAWLSNDGNELQYNFTLKGANNSELTGLINLEYEAGGQNLLRTRTRFYHYVTGADFKKGMAWGMITL